MRLLLRYLLLILLTQTEILFAVKCYSCANEFIVWQWRHFFLKRNYALASSDQECVHRDYKPESMQNCHSTCFIFSLNGTNRETGITRTLGVGRGCSSHFLTDDQHMHLGLGTHTKPSQVGTYLPADFDKLEIYEHWCFCATDYCNTQVCYNRPFGSSEFPGSYIGKRKAGSSCAYHCIYDVYLIATHNEQAGFRPGRSMIEKVFIVRRVIEIWQRYSKPMQLAFLDFEAAFDSPHRCRLLNALRADGVPGKFVRLLDDMNQRTTAAVRTPVGCTTPFEVVTGVRQGAVVGPFLFKFAIDNIMRRTVDQCPADIVLAPPGCLLTDLEYADYVVIFAESSTKLQHVVILVSKLAAAYGLRLRPDKWKQMWVS
ncbi:hypothetical protein RB195_014879 [Necator americanus]|uniref:Reverse transcriptase domain-containing protein n=1 Tax=Necator americanus TaxID=51031 RepID=A0ABR1E208_NECAM